MITTINEWKQINESNDRYLELTNMYIDLATKNGITKEDGIYDCHEWVSIVEESENVEVFLFDEEKEDNFYAINNELDKKFNIQYFEWTAGHSFIKHDGIYIDLALYSEGIDYNKIQKIDEYLSKINMFY